MDSVRRFLYTAKNAALGWRLNRFVPAGHFYSPIPSEADIERALSDLREPGSDIDLRADAQLALLADLTPHVSDDAGPRYTADNDQFGWTDAAVLRAMLTLHRPKRMIEVGSGWSSAQALDTADACNLDTRFTFIDPHPERLYSTLTRADHDRVSIHAAPVQDIALEVFDDLEAGDFLFIDSSHVSKAGSDVNRLYFEVLPRLARGVWVHVHDIPWPFEYPAHWFAEGRAWNEVYLLRASLSGNAAIRIELFSDYLAKRHPQAFKPLVSGIDSGQSSIWLRTH